MEVTGKKFQTFQTNKYWIATEKCNFGRHVIFPFWLTADDMVNIPGGKMLMGTSATDGKDGESPTKEVKIKPFKIDKYPVTNADFR